MIVIPSYSDMSPCHHQEQLDHVGLLRIHCGHVLDSVAAGIGQSRRGKDAPRKRGSSCHTKGFLTSGSRHGTSTARATSTRTSWDLRPSAVTSSRLRKGAKSG